MIDILHSTACVIALYKIIEAALLESNILILKKKISFYTKVLPCIKMNMYRTSVINVPGYMH